jgi:hypothetical protein
MYFGCCPERVGALPPGGIGDGSDEALAARSRTRGRQGAADGLRQEG